MCDKIYTRTHRYSFFTQHFHYGKENGKTNICLNNNVPKKMHYFRHLPHVADCY